MHKSVGAIIRNENDEILMIDRKKKPFGWACPAGHVDDDESPEEALVREVFEETNLEIVEYVLVHHEHVPWNACSRDVKGHDWYVFDVTEYIGDIFTTEEEVNDYRWVSESELKDMDLEDVWQLWKDRGFL